MLAILFLATFFCFFLTAYTKLAIMFIYIVILILAYGLWKLFKLDKMRDSHIQLICFLVLLFGIISLCYKFIENPVTFVNTEFVKTEKSQKPLELGDIVKNSCRSKPNSSS